jgi:hypothetical protein
MSRSDDPSSRPVGKTSPSRPGLKAVPASEGKLRPAKRKPESKSDLRAAGADAPKAEPRTEAREERPPTVVHRYDSDFGVAMMIRGSDES